MKPDRQTVIDATFDILRSIAPEIKVDAINLSKKQRQQIDLDSMDWLNFLLGLHKRFSVDIPEADYGRLLCMNDVVNYIQEKIA